MTFPEKPTHVSLLEGSQIEEYDEKISWEKILPDRRVLDSKKISYGAVSFYMSVDNYGNLTIRPEGIDDMAIYCLESFEKAEPEDIKTLWDVLEALPKYVVRRLFDSMDNAADGGEFYRTQPLEKMLRWSYPSKKCSYQSVFQKLVTQPTEEPDDESKEREKLKQARAKLKQARLEVMADVRCPQYLRVKLDKHPANEDLIELLAKIKEVFEVSETITTVLQVKLAELGGDAPKEQIVKIKEAIRGNERFRDAQLNSWLDHDEDE